MRRLRSELLPNFESERRYPNNFGDALAKVLPGELYVARPPEVLTTLLGSCVSACIRDPVSLVGGMNHFLLPRPGTNPSDNTRDANRFGTCAMENLIREILKAGGCRDRLEVKIFGGASIGSLAARIGHENAEFVEKFLLTGGFRVAARCLGGESARRVVYHLDTGLVRIRTLPRLMPRL